LVSIRIVAIIDPRSRSNNNTLSISQLIRRLKASIVISKHGAGQKLEKWGILFLFLYQPFSRRGYLLGSGHFQQKGAKKSESYWPITGGLK
jgi:hypothetical protein